MQTMEQNIQLKQIDEVIDDTVDKEIKELIDNAIQENPKSKGRPKKYLNTQEAKEKAKEQRKQFKQRQRQKQNIKKAILHLFPLILLHILLELLHQVSQATKADPEIELRFLLRQFNRRLRMDQLKEIIEIAKEDSQQATLKLMEQLNK
ncbi:MAG: hypothetical protein EZS28_022162 [Streblomastix strix]|uniref:Uncharacterized protein n=1 Tax=Streblomastix strix TaxID=222440 RepID=A0A5J4VIH5_9EUKA|nr:MAG: hypothetical protein EZS28_022162 [Streblomastix strix]